MINVKWDDGSALLAQLARNTGRGQLATQAQERALNDDRFRLQLEEQQRQFDGGLAFRGQQAAIDNQMARDQLQGNYALQQQRLAADAYGQQQGNIADLYAKQMAYANEQEQRQYDWNTDSVSAMEKTAQTQLADWQKRQLNPEGKRKLHELMSDFSAIQGQRGTGLREDAYAGVLGDWMEDFGRAGLDIFEESDPTPDELWGQGTRTDADGTVYGLDRNGTWRKLRDAPPRPLTKPEIDANTYLLPTGETMFINPLDGKPTLSTPPKEAADPNAIKPITTADRVRARKQAFDELHQIALAKTKVDEGGSAYTEPPDTAVRQRMAELLGEQGGGEAATPYEGAGTQDDPVRFSKPPTEDDVISLDPDTWFLAPDGTIRQR